MYHLSLYRLIVNLKKNLFNNVIGSITVNKNSVIKKISLNGNHQNII